MEQAKAPGGAQSGGFPQHSAVPSGLRPSPLAFSEAPPPFLRIKPSIPAEQPAQSVCVPVTHSIIEPRRPEFIAFQHKSGPSAPPLFAKPGLPVPIRKPGPIPPPPFVPRPAEHRDTHIPEPSRPEATLLRPAKRKAPVCTTCQSCTKESDNIYSDVRCPASCKVCVLCMVQWLDRGECPLCQRLLSRVECDLLQQYALSLQDEDS